MKNNFLFISKRVLILLLVFNFTSIFAQNQTIKGYWKSISDLPTARWFPGTTVFDGKIFVIGGNVNSTTAPLNVVEVYDPTTDSWETKTPMPTARAQVSACTLNGKIYVIGGSSGPTTWTPVPTVYIYDPVTDKWSQGTDMPNARTEMGIVAVQDKIYAIGGIDGTSTGSKSVDIYNPTTDKWSRGTDMPTARGTMPVCELNGKIYAYGGSNGGASNWNHYAMLEVYDIATDSWTTKKEMPESRSHLTGCVLNNKIYALGGTQLDINLSFATMFSYDPIKDIWESEPSMITAREAFKAVVVDNKMYAIGGTKYPGLIAFSNSEVYDPVPRVVMSNSEMRLPAATASFIGKISVPNSGNLKFSYTKKGDSDAALFTLRNDSVFTAQNFTLNSNKEYQFKVLAVSDQNDSINTTLKIRTYYKVDAVFTSPMGFLLKSSDKKVMLDNLSSRTTSYGFIINSDTITKNIISGAEPFNNIDLIFTSHAHTCHFDPVLLFNSMKNNPKAISIMNLDVKKAMKSYFDNNPEMLKQVFAPDIPLNSFIDTTVAGIKIRLTSIVHETSNILCLNMVLDSVHFLLFDDYNNLSIANYKTIGFTQLPTDVAIIGSLLLNGDQQMIKQTFTPANYINVCHIEGYTDLIYNTCVTNAEKLKALNYQVSVLNWPMQMFSYKKMDNRIRMTTLNSPPKLSRTFKDLTSDKNKTVNVFIPKNSFKDADPGDNVKYSILIDSKPLPEWAKYDSVAQNLSMTPTVAKSYNVYITATDSHLSFSKTTFKLKVTTPAAVENIGKDDKFNVFPNPTQSVINIEGTGDKSYSVSLYNMAGEKIYSDEKCMVANKTIDLSSFSESILFLIITSDGKNEYHKIVKN